MSSSLKKAYRKVAKAEKQTIGAAMGCLYDDGFSFRVATEEIAKTYSINEVAHKRLERACAKLKQARAELAAAKRKV